MPSISSVQPVAGAMLLVVGLVVALPGLAVVPDLIHTEHTHRVTAASTDDVSGAGNATDAPPMFAFENLSAAGKTAVRNARQADDGSYTTGADGRAPEFTYDNDVATAQYVREDGEYYQVTTVQEDRLGEVFGVAALLAGGATAALGTAMRRRDRDGG